MNGVDSLAVLSVIADLAASWGDEVALTSIEA